MKTITIQIQSLIDVEKHSAIKVKPIIKTRDFVKLTTDNKYVTACSCLSSCGGNFSQNGSCPCLSSCGSNMSH